MKLTGLNGIDDIDGIGGLKDIFKRKSKIDPAPAPRVIAPGPPRVIDNPVREVLDLPPPQPEYTAPPAKKKKVIGKIIQKVNKVNPATILIRNAVLAVMKANVLRAAGKLRWGWATAAEAQAAGVSEEARRAAIDAVAKASQKYETLGGNKDAFKAAILNGRGNKDKKVSALAGLSGLGGDEEVEFNDRSEMQAYLGMQGLGEPITATLLSAAGAFMASIAGLLKSINLKKGADGTAEGEPETDFGDGITPPADKKPEDKKKKKKNLADKILDFGQKLTDKGEKIRQDEKTGGGDPKPDEPKPMDPMLLIFGGLLLAGGVYLATKDGKKDKSLSGPAKKAKPKARPKKAAKTSFTKGKNGVLTARIK